MSNRNYTKEADDALEAFNRTIGQIANDRLGLALLEMRGKLKGPLNIIFGMGTEAITYRGHMVYFSPKITLTWGASNPDDAWSGDELIQPNELLPLCKALDDVYDILASYQRGDDPQDISTEGPISNPSEGWIGEGCMTDCYPAICTCDPHWSQKRKLNSA